jgi:predicted negative regulator of RcsB-dependent stress response
MSSARKPGRWQPSRSAVVVVSVALALAGNLATNTIRVSWRWWPLATWTSVAILCAVAIGIERARSSDDSPSRPARDLERITERLADVVKKQWTQEAVLRQLYQPMPLQVRWSSTGRPVAASRDVVLDEPAGNDWQQVPLQGDADEIVAAFRRLPHRQLVVLGQAGAGKSVLAMLLTLRLIEEIEPGQPVPVLLPIASWNPDAESVYDFLVRRLGEEYQFLGRHGEDGRTLAEVLVAHGRVLPVLDGMDELPADMHAQAVESLDRYAAPDRLLVVTCRSREYEQAVRSSGAVMSRSAVVEIEPVTVEQVIAFLSHPAPAKPRWQPVFEYLRAHPDSRLAQTLSTPLMVALARAAYWNPSRDPSALLTSGNSTALAQSLLDGFVRSVYENDQSGTRASGVRQSRSHPADDAGRWLGCLAYHLYLAGTRDLCWWQIRPGFLSRRPSRTRYALAAAFMLTAVIGGLAIGLVFGPWHVPPLSMVKSAWLVPAIWFTEVVALIVGASAFGIFRSMWPASYPPYIARQYRSSRQRRAHYIGVRMIFGVVFGLMAGIPVNALLGLAGGLAFGLAAMLIPDTCARTGGWRLGPRMTARVNLRNAINAAVRYGLAGGVIFAILARFTLGPSYALASGCIAALIYALAAAYSAGLWTWTRFRAAHILLATQGWLPWRLWAFLDDAHSRGALRQAGTTWQFRHALLQDHLARKTNLEHLRARADGGDSYAGRQLAELLAKHDRVDEAIIVLQTRADPDGLAASRIADLLARQGRVDEALTILQTRADVGDQDAGYRLVEFLAGQGREDELRARADTGDRDALHQAADLLAGQDRVDEAIDILRPCADDWAAGRRLAELLAGQGRVDEAIAVLRARADVGDRNAGHQLADLLAGQSRVDEAITLLRAPAYAGDRDAAWRLADLLAGQGQVDDAIAILRPCASDWAAAHRLADLLVGQGRVDEAIAVLRACADAGLGVARHQLADLLAGQGQVDQLRARADAGDHDAGQQLADLLAGQGQMDEAITFLRAPAYAGDRDAARRLAELLAGQGRTDELRARADAGDREAGYYLADLLARQGRLEEAIAVSRARADAGGWGAAHQLIELLVRQGRAEEAVSVARADTGPLMATCELAERLVGQGYAEEAIAILRSHAGDRDADCYLADLLAGQDHVDEAMAIVRLHADAGYWDASYRLAGLLAKQGRVDELSARAEAGDEWAGYQLADFLAGQGRVDEAMAILRPQADGGDRAAGSQLANLLAGQGRVDEAMAILRPRAEAGDEWAGYQLADLLADQGRVDEAMAILRPHANAGDTRAARQINELVARRRYHRPHEPRRESLPPSTPRQFGSGSRTG